MTSNTTPKLFVGDRAPEFTLPDQTGTEVSLRSFLGQQPVVLIFYPGDETPGCTAQLCAVRDDWSGYKQYNAVVLGINPGSAESHASFQQHHNLPIPLLVDADRSVARRYGAIRKFFKTEIIRRSVVIIDTQGIIRYIKRGLPPTSEIMNELKAL